LLQQEHTTAKEARHSKGGGFSTKGTLGCLMQNKRTLTMVDRFPKGEEGIPLAPKVPQKKNYMGPWNSCGFVTLKKTLGHGGQVFKIVEEGYPPRGKT
jgi:hypothetical protein